MESDKGGAFISKEYREFRKKPKFRNWILYTANTYGKRNSKTSNPDTEKLSISKFGRQKNATESVNRALRVMPFTVHTGPKKILSELHHGRKPRTELTKINKDGKIYLTDWSELSSSAPTRPKIPIHVGRDADGEITTRIVMARTKTEEKQVAEGPKKKNRLAILFNS